MWKIKNKEAVSPVIGVILMVAITVVLAAVLYVWVSGFMGGGEQTPTISMSTSSTPTSDGTNVNTTFKIVGVSAPDIKWSDLTPSVAIAGTPSSVSGTITAAGTYVAAGDVIKVVIPIADIADGNKIDLTLVYKPSGGMAGSTYSTYTA